MRPILLLFAFWLAFSPAKAEELKPFKSDSFSQILKENQGRLILVHFWSITCPYCVAHLPTWKQAISRNSQLKVIFVSTDNIRESPAILARLKKNGLEAQENYAFAEEPAAKLREIVDKKWLGELPYNVMVDKDGRREEIAGRLPEEFISQWISMQ